MAGDRYAEMRSIKAHMASLQFGAIPADFRDMKRLWNTPSVRGVAMRRDHEAALFQKGLSDPTKIGQQPVTTPVLPPPAKQVIPNPPSVTSPAPGSIGAFIASIFAAIFRRK